MKKSALLLLIVTLSGCAGFREMDRTDVIVAVGTVLVVGAIIAHDSDNQPVTARECYAIVPPGAIEQRVC